MIKISVNGNGKKKEINCEVHIEGRENAVQEFYGVIKALSDCNDTVLCDALGLLIADKLEGDDDDESEG